MTHATDWYISSGKKNAQFTLRYKTLLQKHIGQGRYIHEEADIYQCNLGVDRERARIKAERIAGCPVRFDDLDLNPYGKTEEEKRRDAEIEQWREEKAARDLQIANDAAERLKKRKEQEEKFAASSTHQGEVGDRLTRELVCVKWVHLGAGTFGERYVVILRDEAFNKYVYFGGGSLSLPLEGETQKISFVVKKHDEREGCKQTIINRPRSI